MTAFVIESSESVRFHRDPNDDGPLRLSSFASPPQHIISTSVGMWRGGGRPAVSFHDDAHFREILPGEEDKGDRLRRES